MLSKRFFVPLMKDKPISKRLAITLLYMKFRDRDISQAIPCNKVTYQKTQWCVEQRISTLRLATLPYESPCCSIHPPDPSHPLRLYQNRFMADAYPD